MIKTLLNKIKEIPTWQLCLFLVIFFAHFIYSNEFTYFGQDVARDAFIAKNAISNNEFIAFYGPKASVWNYYLPPFYYQLHIVMSVLFNNHPLTMKYIVTFIEALTPLIVYLIFKEVVSKKSAILASILYGFSPMILIYATSAWNPNMIPFFTSLSLLMWLYYYKYNTKKSIIVALVSLNIALHLHYQVVLILPFVFLMFIYSLKRDVKDIKYWFLGAVYSLLLLIPYIYQESRTNWHNTQEIINYFTKEHSQYFDQISKPAFIHTFIPQFLEKVLSISHTKYVAGRVLFFVGMGMLALYSLKNRLDVKKPYFLFFVYFCCIFVMLRVYKGDKLDYYLSTLFIYPYFLLAILFEKIKASRYIALIGIAILMYPNVSLLKPTNNLLTLKNEMSFIEQNISSNFRLLAHNDDYINRFAYGVYTYTNLTISDSGNEVVEVCENNNCAWNKKYMCQFNRGYTYATLLKSTTPYQETIGTFGNETISVTKFDTIKDVGYAPYIYDDVYGSDTLVENAYNWK